VNASSSPRGGVAPAAGVESTRMSDVADAQTEIDVAIFTQWVDAYARHQPELAAFYRKRFRPRAVLLGVGCAVLVGTLIWVATFPVSISI
jgi:hypothetical protein